MSVKNKDCQESHEKCRKNMQIKENEFRKIKSQMEQKIQFLQQELKDYQQRQQNNKKINESIMVTYQQNQSIREQVSVFLIQHINRQIAILTNKHQSEIKKMKEIYEKEIKIQQDSLVRYKNKYQEGLIELDKKKVECDRKILELSKKYESDLKNEVERKEKQTKLQAEIVEQKLKQAEGLVEMYKQLINKRANTLEDDVQNCSAMRKQPHVNRVYQQQSSKKTTHFDIENEVPGRQSRMSRIKNIQQNNIQDRKRLSVSRESVKLLTMKIDRAVTQLKGNNNSKLHERINQKLAKRLR